MLTEEQREKVISFSQKCVEKNDPWHKFDHLHQVADTALLIAEKEDADKEICEVAALLHDICKAEPGDHGTNGALKAKEFLLSIGVEIEFAERVADAIHFHDKENRERTPESAVLWDSDKLYILTPKGFVARMCPYWVVKLGEKEGLEKAIHEYYFFKERLNTKTAKQIVESHSALMEELIAELKK
jgi:putative nucleotidyltransferase with HDIG domain